MKKYRVEIVISLIMIVLAIVLIKISDLFNIQMIDELNELSKIIFGSLIGLVAIWISGYFILIQLYKNTYPMEIIEKSFLKTVKIILIFSIINIFMGIIIIALYNNFILEIYYIILFIINVILIFYNTYMINRTFTINTYIDKYYNELDSKLEDNNITKKEIDKIFYEFSKFFDDCIVKDEYYVCNNISKKTGEMFRRLIEHCNQIMINGNEEVAEYLLERIINSGIYQILSSKNSKSQSFISDLFMQQQQNIVLCIKIDRLSWFKKYINNVNLLIKECQNDEDDMMDEILYLNRQIGKELLDKEDIWIEWFINELYNINISLKYAYKNINLNYFAKLISYILIMYLNNDSVSKNNSKYDILNQVLKKFTAEVTHVNDNIQEIVINYSIYGNRLVEKQDIEKIKDFIEIITGDSNRTIDSEKWNEFILYYLNITLEKWKDELGQQNRLKIIDIILDLSLNDSNSNYCSMLPEYDKIIFDSRYNTDIINQICEEFEELFTRLIINNNIKMFYLVLRLLKDSILKLEQKDKNIQKKLFNLFEIVLLRTLNIENKKFIELTFSMIDDCIENLDKNKKISDDFGNYIIQEISDIAMYKSNISEINIINTVILMAGFLEEGKEYSFISRNADKKKLLYKNIYNIGINSIENNMEKAVRTVSNTLGWFIITSIKNDAAHLTNYLIERTIDLFKIAQNMEISEKTLVFIMTLFTTVGTYCCSDVKYGMFLSKILIILKNENLARIKTAIELRTKENNMWDKLFEGKTQELTNKFLAKITENSNSR